MSEAELKVMTATALAQDFKTIYREALDEEVSDVDLATLLLDANFFAIRDLDDQELFFATSQYLDAFLAAAVPLTVSFNEERLKIWAKEALEFERQNVRHETFSDIFCSRLQYNESLQRFLVFEKRGNYLLDYFKQLRIDSAYIGDTLPLPFLMMVQNAAQRAIGPALFSLSCLLTAHGKIGKPKGGAKIAGVLSVKRTYLLISQGCSTLLRHRD